VAVQYVFNHGDGTLDPSPVSRAYYAAPGSYVVKLKWSYQGQTGTVICGTVIVTSGPTPTPTATPTPTPLAVSCAIAPQRPVVVREILTFTATHTPNTVPIQFVFDHGDGTLDPRQVSHAFYEAAGTYEVRLNWAATAGRSGSILCGTVTVTD